VAEAKFSNGRAAQAGTVSVFDGANTKLFDLQIVPGETTRFAVDPEAGGYLIEVKTPNGHSDYWVLTPNDLQGPNDPRSPSDALPRDTQFRR